MSLALTEREITRALTRKYHLPRQLRTAVGRVHRLKAEAEQFGLHALLTDLGLDHG